jgi:predicted dehydrogenase
VQTASKVNDTIKLGIIGLHNHYHIYPMADYLLKGLPGLTLACVYDERTSLAKEFATKYQVPDVCSSRESLLADSDADAVLIMSDTASHHADLLASISQKKHVLLDKPIAINVREATEMVTAAHQAGIVFMMAYLIRFLPPYRKAKELIDEGVIGRPLSMRIGIRCPLTFIRDNPNASEPGWYTDPKRAGAGGFLDHGIHYADTLRFLLGSEPVEVFGKVAKLTDHRIGVDDYGVCVVTTDKEEIVTIESTWHAPAWYAPLTSQEECLIVGTDGEIHIHYQTSPQLEVSGKGNTGRLYYDWLGEERYEVCYRDVLLEFADTIRGRRKLSVSGVDGKIALQLIEASYESSKTGKVVHLEPDPFSTKH